MQKLVFLLCLFININYNAKSQWIDKAKEILQKTIDKNKTITTNKTDSAVTEEEAGQGIKQALNQGVAKAIKFLNK
jgi:hypothetical protein